MTADLAGLERGYRRWLRWYPPSFRREHEAEVLAVLLAGARAGQRRPDPAECLDLVRGGLCMRVRPSVPRSARAVHRAVRLMYAGAVVELVAAITIVATVGDVRSATFRRDPGLTEDVWRANLAAHVVPTAAGAALAVGFWLWMAWSIGRGRRWPAAALTAFLGVNTFGLLDGLARGSAAVAGPDVAVGLAVWLLSLAAAALAFHVATGPARPAA